MGEPRWCFAEAEDDAQGVTHRCVRDAHEDDTHRCQCGVTWPRQAVAAAGCPQDDDRG